MDVVVAILLVLLTPLALIGVGIRFMEKRANPVFDLYFNNMNSSNYSLIDCLWCGDSADGFQKHDGPAGIGSYCVRCVEYGFPEEMNIRSK